MKLSNCKIGVVVETKHNFKIGHIIGFSYSSNKEIIPVVQFPSIDNNIENFKLKSIHYDDLKIYKKNNAK